MHYLNCGDWVESCTAVMESHAGEMHVVHWLERAPDPHRSRADSDLPADLQAAPASADAAAAPMLTPASLSDNARV